MILRDFIRTVAFLLFLNTSVRAQQRSLIGEWLTPYREVIEFYEDGEILTAKKTSTEKDNCKSIILARDIKETSAGIFEGVLIDPKNGKTYKARFILNQFETELEVKIKWGLISFSQSWKREWP